MSLKYGRRILGETEYARQAAKQAEMVRTHGGPNARYGHRIVEQVVEEVREAQTETPRGPEPAIAAAPGAHLTVADIRQAIEAEPQQLERLALLELTSAEPRKGALEAMLTAAKKGGEDYTDLVTDLEAALTPKE